MQGEEYTVQELISFIFKEIVQMANQQGENVQDVILTAPCYYHKYDTAKIVQVAESIGLNVVDAITDPAAIVLNYAHRLSSEDKNVLVYDLGGGTLDLALLNIQSIDKLPSIICTGGNNRLGGKDWDNVLSRYIVDQIVEETGYVEEDIDENVIQYVYNHVDLIKKRLSIAQKASIHIPFEGKKIFITITRDTFEELTKPLVDQTMNYVENVQTDVDKVLLAGGCAYMPMIRDALENRFPGKVLLSQPDTAVVRGTVIYGQKRQTETFVCEQDSARNE
ncbi:MAG: Hsp70 family protein [Erysipelotrichaceae bacterium]|nr:Hsp70 family protein [Erysipelotrichaceae bacterium]